MVVNVEKRDTKVGKKLDLWYERRSYNWEKRQKYIKMNIAN